MISFFTGKSIVTKELMAFRAASVSFQEAKVIAAKTCDKLNRKVFGVDRNLNSEPKDIIISLTNQVLYLFEEYNAIRAMKAKEEKLEKTRESTLTALDFVLTTLTDPDKNHHYDDTRLNEKMTDQLMSLRNTLLTTYDKELTVPKLHEESND